MTRIAETFNSLREKERKALLPYITPEFPVRGVTVPLALMLEESGADLIELGIPFSDPIADGPVIQNSSRVALRNGVSLRKVLGFVQKIRQQSTIPIILMGYFNSFFCYGLGAFCKDAGNAGVDGLIIPDLPPEEADVLMGETRRRNLSITFLIAPTTPPERIREIDHFSTDFSYCVSVTGVTGVRKDLGRNDRLENFLKRVKANTKKPFVVGFGISSRSQVLRIWDYADGAVVGSALIEQLGGCRTVRQALLTGKKLFRSLRS